MDHGRVDGGMFVVVDAPPRRAGRLELVEVSDEEAFFEEPPPAELFDAPEARPPRRGWRWAAGAALCATIGLGGWYFARPRPAPTSMTTITEAQIPPPAMATPEPTATAPAMAVVEHEPPEVTAPRAAPRAPTRRAPKWTAPHRKPRVTRNDPLTL